MIHHYKTDHRTMPRIFSARALFLAFSTLICLAGSTTLSVAQNEEMGGWQHPDFQKKILKIDEDEQNIPNKLQDLCSNSSWYNFWYKPIQNSWQNAKLLRQLNHDIAKYKKKEKDLTKEQKLTAEEKAEYQTDLPKKYKVRILPGIALSESVWNALPSPQKATTVLAEDFRQHYVAWFLCGIALSQSFKKIQSHLPSIRLKRSPISLQTISLATHGFKNRTAIWKRNTLGLLSYLRSELQMTYEVLNTN